MSTPSASFENSTSTMGNFRENLRLKHTCSFSNCLFHHNNQYVPMEIVVKHIKLEIKVWFLDVHLILLIQEQAALCHLSRLMTKPTKWHVRPAKTQISLGIRPVCSESSLSAWWKLGPLATHWAHRKDSDQTGRMPRLIFAGRTII